MSWTVKLINLLGIGLPVVGLITAVVLLWNRGVGVAALANPGFLVEIEVIAVKDTK